MAGSGIPSGRADKSEFWRQVVEGQSGSGLSIRAWCQQRGVSVAGFYGWRRKLVRGTVEVAGLQPLVARTQLQSAQALPEAGSAKPESAHSQFRFAELILTGACLPRTGFATANPSLATPASAGSPPPATATLSIDLDDARVEVPAGFDPATLRVVLEALLPARVRGGSC